MRFDLVACAYHVWTDCCFADQGQTSDALFLFSTVPQDLRPHHFVHVFANVYAPLSFLFLESLNDLHIKTVNLQRGYSEDVAIYIDDYGKYTTSRFGISQRLNQSSKSHLHFSLTELYAHNNQL